MVRTPVPPVPLATVRNHFYHIVVHMAGQGVHEPDEGSDGEDAG